MKTTETKMIGLNLVIETPEWLQKELDNARYNGLPLERFSERYWELYKRYLTTYIESLCQDRDPIEYRFEPVYLNVAARRN